MSFAPQIGTLNLQRGLTTVCECVKPPWESPGHLLAKTLGPVGGPSPLHSCPCRGGGHLRLPRGITAFVFVSAPSGSLPSALSSAVPSVLTAKGRRWPPDAELPGRAHWQPHKSMRSASCTSVHTRPQVTQQSHPGRPRVLADPVLGSSQ